ncbi:MAG TPA: ISAzo13 family transposase, partial [Archangium sp.]|nr:ISAzo13 family transposase [Archangium sp.]
MSSEKLIAEKYEEMRPVLDEQSRRRWAATEALALGRGGISAVARATGLSRPTIRAGIHEIRHGRTPVTHSDGRLRLRRPGAGRKPRTYHEPSLLSDLEALV